MTSLPGKAGATGHIPYDGLSAFTYHLLPGAGLAPWTDLTLLGDELDMERGVLCIPPAVLAQRSVARFCYLPVQAIPQGMAAPDLVAEVFAGQDHITTLHFCVIWRVVQDDRGLQAFERVSFPRPEQATHYNTERISVCSLCHRLHRHACVLASKTSLEQALVLSGLALCAHEGYVYFISSEYTPSNVSPLFRGKVYWYAITGLWGLEACYGFSPVFTKLEMCHRFLSEREVPLYEGWMAVKEPLRFPPHLIHHLRNRQA